MGFNSFPKFATIYIQAPCWINGDTIFIQERHLYYTILNIKITLKTKYGRIMYPYLYRIGAAKVRKFPRTERSGYGFGYMVPIKELDIITKLKGGEE